MLPFPMLISVSISLRDRQNETTEIQEKNINEQNKENIEKVTRFEVITGVSMNTAFWNVTPCSLVYRYGLRETYCFLLPGRKLAARK
jgi:hypothetical protein